MNKVLFFGAFIAAGVPMAIYLASKDPEPDMAGLSLLFFCFVGAITSLLAYIAGSYKFQRFPNTLHGFCTGAIVATSFFSTLSFISKNFNFWPCLLSAFLLSAFLALTFPLVGTKKPNPSFKRDT